jgi:hypothetical protein
MGKMDHTQANRLHGMMMKGDQSEAPVEVEAEVESRL